jgi:hypothetical protein
MLSLASPFSASCLTSRRRHIGVPNRQPFQRDRGRSDFHGEGLKEERTLVPHPVSERGSMIGSMAAADLPQTGGEGGPALGARVLQAMRREGHPALLPLPTHPILLRVSQ